MQCVLNIYNTYYVPGTALAPYSHPPPLPPPPNTSLQDANNYFQDRWRGVVIMKDVPSSMFSVHRSDSGLGWAAAPPTVTRGKGLPPGCAAALHFQVLPPPAEPRSRLSLRDPARSHLGGRRGDRLHLSKGKLRLGTRVPPKACGYSVREKRACARGTGSELRVIRGTQAGPPRPAPPRPRPARSRPPGCAGRRWRWARGLGGRREAWSGSWSLRRRRHLRGRQQGRAGPGRAGRAGCG